MLKWIFTPTLTVIAIAALFGLAALFDSLSGHAFLNTEGLVIVVGGSVANAFLSFQREDVLRAFGTIRDMLKKALSSRERLHKDIMQMIIWAYVVQERGLLALEKEAGRVAKNPLLRYGIDLAVTGYSAEKIREMIRTVSDAEFERGCAPVTVLRNMAATAPAFGMVGTLVGMVMLLKHVGGDITSIGSGLAVAMLSTLYGILVARLICLPAADKLLQTQEQERFRNYMLTEGFAMLAEKHNPVYMLDRLNSFLEPSKHFDLDLSSYKQLASQRHMAMAA